MRKFLMVLFMIPGMLVLGQNIEFNLYINNTCIDSIYKADSYRLTSLIDTNKIFNSNTLGTCNLVDSGYYKIFVFDRVSIDNSIYHFQKPMMYSDTLRIETIYECLEPTSSPRFIGFCYCDVICEGYKIDYYSNGNKRIEGNFIKGQPIGELKYYYSSGKLKRVERYSRSNKLIKVLNYSVDGLILKY